MTAGATAGADEGTLMEAHWAWLLGATTAAYHTHGQTFGRQHACYAITVLHLLRRTLPEHIDTVTSEQYVLNSMQFFEACMCKETGKKHYTVKH